MIGMIFVIVLVGIFLGTTVLVWNDGRKDK